MIAMAGMGFASGAKETESHVKSVTAITNVYGDGQKVSAVAIEYDAVIDTSKLETGDFAVEGKTVTRVYANTAAETADGGVNGSFVIVELDTAIAEETGMPAGPSMNANNQGGDAPNGAEGSAGGPGAGGPGGPAIGEKSDKPATATILTATVTQTGDIVTAKGKTYKASETAYPSDKTVDLMIGGFKQLVFEDPAYGNQALMYNLYVPENYDPSVKYPLVLFMHDAGVVSNNPTETLTQGLGAVIWATPEDQAKHPCFVLAPQYDCVIVGDGTDTADQVDMTINLVKELMTEYSIDANRLYNTGQSMGGMTSIAMNIKYPDFFAASLLVACQWDPTVVAPMAGKPLWIIVSEGDNKANPGQDAIIDVLTGLGDTVNEASWSAESSPEEFDTLVADMLSANCDINYAVFQGGSHRYTWQYAYSIPGVRDWLLSQVKTDGQTAQALFDQGDALSKAGDNSGAVGYFTAAAELGNARACEMLASMYAEGRGVTQDYAKAVSWNEAGIKAGSARSSMQLGILYMNGTGVAQNPAKALELFDKAKTLGDFKAPRWAGIIYLKGVGGISVDVNKAAELFSYASEKGDVTANYYLGYLYEKGLSFQQDYAKAAAFYEKAAPATGHAEAIACTALGRLYENGLGVAKDKAKAKAWYQRGAELGDADAQAAYAKLGGK